MLEKPQSLPQAPFFTLRPRKEGLARKPDCRHNPPVQERLQPVTPKAHTPLNRSGKRTAHINTTSGERRGCAHRRGKGRLKRQPKISGHRTDRGACQARCHAYSDYRGAPRNEQPPNHPFLSSPSKCRRQAGGFRRLDAAGQLRLANRRTRSRAHRCRHV